jgi:RHS repeat-associated protein
LVLTDDAVFQAVRVNQVVAGILKNGQFIPLSTDSRASVIEGKNGRLDVLSAYGERKEDRTSYSNVIDYVSQGYDSDLRAYRMEQRDFDPVLKRYHTPDPLFFEQPNLCVDHPEQCNLYGYSRGNPISYVDPTGKYSEPNPALGSQQIVIDGFIEHASTLAWKGDSRWFGQPSTLEQSRLTIHVDTVTGQMQEHVSPSHLTFMNRDFAPSNSNSISIAGSGNMFEIKIQAINSAAPSGSPSIDNTIQLMKNPQGEWQSRMIGDAFPSWEINQWNGNSRQPLMESLSSGNSLTGPLNLIDGTKPRIINYGENTIQKFIP